MVGIQEKDLTDLPVKIMDNLDLIPSYIDFQDFTKYLYQNTNNEYEETHLLEPLFNPLKKKYDVILLDVPPFSIEITRNAVIFSDFALISLQTHDDSLSGAEEYVNTLSKLQQEYQLDIEIIGILPMLHDARNGVDQTIIQSAKDEFGEENVFTNIVTQMARIKRFPINGITDKDRFDKRVLDKYQQVTDELLSRIGLFIDDKEPSKMPSKKPNILQRRVTGAVKPSEEYHATDNATKKENKSSSMPKNQKKSLKVSAETYKDMKVLKTIEHVSFDYEIIQLLIDQYYKDMTEEQQRRYTVLRENM